MDDKRRLERFPLKAPAKIIPLDSRRKNDEISLETRDICSGGAFFHTSHTVPEGTEVDVDVVLPLDRLVITEDSEKRVHLKITGRVLRSEAEGIAVCFDGNYQIRQLDPGPQTQESEKNA